MKKRNAFCRLVDIPFLKDLLCLPCFHPTDLLALPYIFALTLMYTAAKTFPPENIYQQNITPAKDVRRYKQVGLAL